MREVLTNPFCTWEIYGQAWGQLASSTWWTYNWNPVLTDFKIISSYVTLPMLKKQQQQQQKSHPLSRAVTFYKKLSVFVALSILKSRA